MDICAEGAPQQAGGQERACDFVGGEVSQVQERRSSQDAELPDEEPSCVRNRSSSCPAKNMGAAGRLPLPPIGGIQSLSFRDSLTTRALASTPFEVCDFGKSFWNARYLSACSSTRSSSGSWTFVSHLPHPVLSLQGGNAAIDRTLPNATLTRAV